MVSFRSATDFRPNFALQRLRFEPKQERASDHGGRLRHADGGRDRARTGTVALSSGTACWRRRIGQPASGSPSRPSLLLGAPCGSRISIVGASASVRRAACSRVVQRMLSKRTNARSAAAASARNPGVSLSRPPPTTTVPAETAAHATSGSHGCVWFELRPSPRASANLTTRLILSFPAVGACWSHAPGPLLAARPLLLLAGGERDERLVDGGYCCSS
jgi:hypothetical protein